MKILRVDNYIIETPILKILELLQITLTNGKLKSIKPGLENIVVTCPIHANGKEKTPACNIYIGDSTLEYGFYRCLVCENKGSFVEFVSHCFDSSIDFAKNWLIKHFGKLADDVISLGDPINLNKAFKARKAYPNTFLKEELDKYQSWHPYLASRKLSKDTCDKFKIKYDPHFRQIIFPCFDTKGNIIMLPQRSIDTKTFYIPVGIEKPVYCLDHIIKNNIKKVILVEGPFDCLTCYEYGASAIATLGNPSDFQIEQINRSCIEFLYLAFDNDEAGRKMANKVKQKLSPRIITEDLILPINKKDINELTKDEFIKLFS